MVSHSTVIVLRSRPSLSDCLVDIPENLIHGLLIPSSLTRSTGNSIRSNNRRIVNQTSNTDVSEALVNKLIDRLIVIETNALVKDRINGTTDRLELLRIHERNLHCLRPSEHLIDVLVDVSLNSRKNISGTTNKRVLIRSRSGIVDIHRGSEVNPTATSISNDITLPSNRSEGLTDLRITLLKLTFKESHTGSNSGCINGSNTRTKSGILHSQNTIRSAESFATSLNNIRHISLTSCRINP